MKKLILGLIVIISLLTCDANPDNLEYEDNFLRGLKKSESMNKPILIHFTGHNLPYNEFQSDLITSRHIQSKLKEDFITIQLYTDYKKLISEKDTMGLYQLGIERLQKIKTIGNLNIMIQIELFQNNSQPFYVIMDSQRNILVEPFGYTKKNRELFLNKLEEGINQFENNR